MTVILGIAVYMAGFLLIFISVYLVMYYARMSRRGCDENLPGSSGKPGAGRMVYRMLRDMVGDLLSPDDIVDRRNPFWWLAASLRLGLWLVGGWTLCLIAGALAGLLGVAVDAHATVGAALLYYLTIPVGFAGFTLSTFGVAVLIMRYMSDPVLRKSLRVWDFPDVFLAFAVLATGVLLWGSELTFVEARAVMAQVLSFSSGLQLTPLLTIHLVLLDVMVVYIPLSRMISYGNRYFAPREGEGNLTIDG